jgi:hypothetical protein
MKRILSIIGWTTLLFVVLTLLTLKIESPSDGNDTFGFPFIFYKAFGGKRTYYPPNEFAVLFLLFDVFTAYVIVFVSRAVFIKLKRK